MIMTLKDIYMDGWEMSNKNNMNLKLQNQFGF